MRAWEVWLLAFLACGPALAGGVSLELESGLSPPYGDSWLSGEVAWDLGGGGVSWEGLTARSLLYSKTTGWVFYGGARYSLVHVAADPELDGVLDQGLLFRITGFPSPTARFESLTMFGVDDEAISFSQPGGKVEFDLRPRPGLPYFPYFTAQKFLLKWGLPGGGRLESETLLVRTGFSHQRFSLTFSLGFVSFELCSTFQVRAHSVTLDPSLNLDCGWLRIFAQPAGQTPSFIGGLVVYGVRVRARMGDLSLEAMCSLDEQEHDLVLDPYVARVSLEGCRPGEGGRALFRADAYFHEGPEWGRLDLCLRGPVASGFEVWTKTGIDPGGVCSWGLGARWRW
ncbi:hypothetical protein H5T52_06415 [Candidatus Bipolaricaulota bacterium]|nr:hypothetical protein [Candidatus Bipolaricaulota bacterium]